METDLKSKKRIPHIYIFLNGIANDKAQYAAVSEDGYCLGAVLVPVKATALAKTLLGKNAEYGNYYPNGYELIWIDDINAPRNAPLLDKIRAATSNKIREHRHGN
jgi:hypothetical protein